MAQEDPFEITKQVRELTENNIKQTLETMAQAMSVWTKVPLDMMTSWFRGIQELGVGFAKSDEDSLSQEVVDAEKPINGRDEEHPIAVGREAMSLNQPIESPKSPDQRSARLKTLFLSFRRIFLLICLASLSWFATYTGMLELIRANTGDIPIVHQVAIGFAVATLMLMVLFILDALFSPISWWVRTLYIFGYVFLTLISIGFSFGFFWKVLRITRRGDPVSRSCHRRGAEGTGRG